MKKTAWGLVILMLVSPMAALAQSSPQPPASWVSFQQEESAKKAAFFQQLKADRDSFMQTHPDVKTYFDQMRATSKARMDAWRQSHPLRKGSALSPGQ